MRSFPDRGGSNVTEFSSLRQDERQRCVVLQGLELLAVEFAGRVRRRADVERLESRTGRRPQGRPLFVGQPFDGVACRRLRLDLGGGQRLTEMQHL